MNCVLWSLRANQVLGSTLFDSSKICILKQKLRIQTSFQNQFAQLWNVTPILFIEKKMSS